MQKFRQDLIGSLRLRIVMLLLMEYEQMEKFDEQFRREMLVDGRKTFEEVLGDEVQLHVMSICEEKEIAEFSD